MSNPSTEQARAIVDGLLRSGVDEIVLAPGSRNGPLSIALAQASATGRLRLHVRLDERSASFLALGLARRTGRPAAVVCTSGTAAAHFHAAAYEATEAGVPLLLLTADRPAELRGTGANQTIDQRDMFGVSVRKSIDAPTASGEAPSFWRALVADAVAVACGSASTAPGAVHLNLPFAEPLVPGDGDERWTGALPAGAVVRPSVDVPRGAWSKVWPAGGATPHGVVLTSDPEQAADAVAFAEALGWPLLAEPGSGARRGANAICDYVPLLADPALRPEVVVTIGRFALSRAVAAFVREAPRHVAVGRSNSDPLGTVQEQLVRLPDVSKLASTDAEWLAGWKRAESAQPSAAGFSSAHGFVARLLAAAEAGDLVWYGPSSVIRLAERVAPAFDDVVVSRMNRGTNGIDGVVSSAIGAALAHQRAGGGPALALMGDLTFLHDINGLLLEAKSPIPDLTFVILDSNGGRIFAALEQGAPEYAGIFDQVYGTPHNRDIAAIARGYGAETTTVSDSNGLVQAMAEARARGGLNAIVINDRG